MFGAAASHEPELVVITLTGEERELMILALNTYGRFQVLRALQ